MPDLPMRLARKWCPTCKHEAWNDHGRWLPHVHKHIAAAIREALEEAEKVIKKEPDGYMLQSCCISYGGDSFPTKMKDALTCHSELLAAALAALREGK